MKTLLALILLCTLSAQAQLTLRNAAYAPLLVPPATGGGAFTPASLTNLLVWYNINAQSEANGDPISTFTDQSGNGNHSTGSGGSRPTMNTTGINGGKTADFDGSDDSVGGSYSGGSNFSAYWLVQLSANLVGGLFDSAPSAANVFRIMNGGSSEPYTELHAGNPYVTWRATQYSNNPVVVIQMNVINVTGTGRYIEVKTNGVIALSGTGTDVAINWSSPRIGNINNGGPYLNAKLRQFVLTSSTNSVADQDSIVNYLKTEGGL